MNVENVENQQTTLQILQNTVTIELSLIIFNYCEFRAVFLF